MLCTRSEQIAHLIVLTKIWAHKKTEEENTNTESALDAQRVLAAASGQ